MKVRFSPAVERARLRLCSSPYSSNQGDPFGVFQFLHEGVLLRCIASFADDAEWRESGLPGPPWNHVSVSTSDRTPTWEEMCFVKDLFWPAETCVLQFHPPKSQYVNYHPNCLHLWECPSVSIPTPPPETVGPRK